MTANVMGVSEVLLYPYHYLKDLIVNWVTLKHDGTVGTDGTSNCFEDVRIAIVQNGIDGTANCCASCL